MEDGISSDISSLGIGSSCSMVLEQAPRNIEIAVLLLSSAPINSKKL